MMVIQAEITPTLILYSFHKDFSIEIRVETGDSNSQTSQPAVPPTSLAPYQSEHDSPNVKSRVNHLHSRLDNGRDYDDSSSAPKRIKHESGLSMDPKDSVLQVCW